MRNPVWGREVGMIARSARISWVLMTIVALSGGLVLLSLASASYGQIGGGLPSRTGVRLFSFLAALQLGLVMLMAPGLTAGSISGERERRTLEPLFQTGLSATAFVMGKLGAALAYMAMVVVALAPVTGVLLLLGGVNPRQVLLVYAVLLVTALMQTSLGLCASALSLRTQTAASAAYVVTAVLTVLSILPTWVAGPALSSWGVRAEVFAVVAMANPVAALASTTGGPVFSPLLNAVLGSAGPSTAGQTGSSTSVLLPGGSGISAFGSSWIPPAYQGLTASSGASQGSAMRMPLPIIAYGYLFFATFVSLVMWMIAIVAVRPRSGPLLRPRRTPTGGDVAG